MYVCMYCEERQYRTQNWRSCFSPLTRIAVVSSVRYYVPIKLVKLEPKQVSETTIQHACETCENRGRTNTTTQLD